MGRNKIGLSVRPPVRSFVRLLVRAFVRSFVRPFNYFFNKGMLIKINIYLGAFVTYCDPILVSIYLNPVLYVLVQKMDPWKLLDPYEETEKPKPPSKKGKVIAVAVK